MKNLFFAAAAIAALAAPARAEDAALAAAVAGDYPYVFELYKHFHQNPELSFKESESARRMTDELKSLGFTIATGVGDKWTKTKAKADAGKVHDGVGGFGFVAVHGPPVRNCGLPVVHINAPVVNTECGSH